MVDVFNENNPGSVSCLMHSLDLYFLLDSSFNNPKVVVNYATMGSLQLMNSHLATV